MHAEVPLSQPPRAQGGWRTAEVMKQIYTKLIRSEVEEELFKVAQASSVQLDWAQRISLFGKSAEEIKGQPASLLSPFLAHVAGRLDEIDTDLCKATNLHLVLKWLTQHDHQAVRNHAINLHTKLRSAHMGQAAVKRVKI